MIDWDKEFPIASLTRVDLKAAGFSDQQIQLLTDEDMTTIASKLEDAYRDNQLAIDLEIEVLVLLDTKKPHGNKYPISFDDKG